MGKRKGTETFKRIKETMSQAADLDVVVNVVVNLSPIVRL